MTDKDMPAFLELVQQLCVVFPLRGSEFEIGRLKHAHFKALRAYPLAAVRVGAEAGLKQWKHFPKPAEWIDAIPPRREARADVPAMSESRAYEYRRAESLHWEDTPCDCADCTQAGVSTMPRRFVPEIDEDGRDLHMSDPLQNRIVTAGHWAHGAELAGYYLVRERFFTTFHRVVKDKTIR